MFSILVYIRYRGALIGITSRLLRSRIVISLAIISYSRDWCESRDLVEIVTHLNLVNETLVDFLLFFRILPAQPAHLASLIFQLRNAGCLIGIDRIFTSWLVRPYTHRLCPSVTLAPVLSRIPSETKQAKLLTSSQYRVELLGAAVHSAARTGCSAQAREILNSIENRIIFRNYARIFYEQPIFFSP